MVLGAGSGLPPPRLSSQRDDDLHGGLGGGPNPHQQTALPGCWAQAFAEFESREEALQARLWAW